VPTRPETRARTQVGLVVIDEIHLLGADRGPILEVIVSRMRCVRSRAPNWARGIQRLAPHALTQWL